MLTSSSKLRIIVGGMVGQYPLGGVAWDYFHYVLALAELGHDVYYHEDTNVWPFDPVKGYPSDDGEFTGKFMQTFFERHAPHLKDRWHYVLLKDKHFGMSKEAFDEVAKTADIFLNVSGATYVPDNLSSKCIKVFMDTDPGYNQILMHAKPEWAKHAEGWLKDIRAKYDRYLTYAENIWGEDCHIPRLDIDWLPTRCVVTMSPWKEFVDQAPPPDAAFTTVMSWTYYGGLVYKGVEYDAKPPEFEKFSSLPARVKTPLLLAIGGDKAPLDMIHQTGWRTIKAPLVTTTGESYLHFIRDSLGEWSIAKNIYVATNSGWFSCRTACYLAAGRPSVVQDTAWSRFLPSGAGLFAFTTMDECVEAIERIASDATKQRQLAYEVAREYLAPDRVLPPMLEAIQTGQKILPPSR